MTTTVHPGRRNGTTSRRSKRETITRVMSGDLLVGTLVARDNETCVVDPRPELLCALFKGGHPNRILDIDAVVITDDDVEVTRGLCTLVAYLRGLKRTSALPVLVRNDAGICTTFLRSCCERLVENATFRVSVDAIDTAKPIRVGDATMTVA